jgi:maleate cis-trans isomerase
MVIMARSARLGFLVPPGNPTVEPEVIAMAPKGVSVHFSRMVAHGPTGTLEGKEAQPHADRSYRRKRGAARHGQA